MSKMTSKEIQKAYEINQLRDQIENKFNAFKDYAEQRGIQWGFVRDKDNQLYINNTEFSIDMADDAWQPLENVF